MAAIPSLLNPDMSFVPEDELIAKSRYAGFCADFHSRLYSRYPSLHGRFRFFRNPDTEDVWSICEYGTFVFGVQLDPDIEVICIWDAAWFTEIGAWAPDPVEDAIKTVAERYFHSV